MDTTLDRDAMRLAAHLASVQEVHEDPLELRLCSAFGLLDQALTEYLRVGDLDALRWARTRAAVYTLPDADFAALLAEPVEGAEWPDRDDVEHGDVADRDFEGAF